MDYTGPSVVDYLSSTGKDNSFSARKLLAEKMGVQNYTGTGNQNTQLLTSLRHLLTKPETSPQEQRTLQPITGETQNESRLLSVPDTSSPTPTQLTLSSTPKTQFSTTQPSPTDLFNKTLEEMMKAAQSSGNDDLVSKRNAIIQARFNAGRNTTPEELRVLSPQAQASLRNLDQSGLEDQLGGVNNAIQSRDVKLKNEQAARQNVLDTLLKKQQIEKTDKQNLPTSAQEYQYYSSLSPEEKKQYDDYQNVDANRKAQVAKITAGGLNSVQQNAAFKLADDYEKASGDLGKIISNYNRVVASAKNASPAGDLSLIFAYMKTLDPTSVVREGEFATASNAGSIGDKLMNQYNKILNGERLTEAQRNDFVARAKGLYQSAINQQKQIDKTFSDRADKFGIPADYVIRSQNSFNDSPTNSQYSSLKEYKNSVSPEQFNKISSIIQQENLDETDALKLINKLGFNSPLSMGQNGSIAPKIAQKYPEGAKGGQCTTFLHSLVQFPPIGDGKTQKFASVDKFGITADQLRQNPQIGDVIVTGENKTYGHTAMINAILPNGFRVTESNFKGDERVTHDRIIPFNSPQIYGAIRGPLKV